MKPHEIFLYSGRHDYKNTMPRRLVLIQEFDNVLVYFHKSDWEFIKQTFNLDSNSEPEKDLVVYRIRNVEVEDILQKFSLLLQENPSFLVKDNREKSDPLKRHLSPVSQND